MVRYNKDGSIDKRYTTALKEKGIERKKLNLTKEQEVEIFKALAHKTYLEVANEYGIDSVYENPGAKRIFVHNIYRRIKKAPDVYGLSKDTIDVVTEAVDSRRIVYNPTQVFVEEREVNEFKDKLEVVRDQVLDLVSKKLEKISKGKNIDTVKLSELSSTLSMVIDKARLVRGESTEHVTHFAKMDLGSVSPEDALKLVLKAREATIESKK